MNRFEFSKLKNTIIFLLMASVIPLSAQAQSSLSEWFELNPNGPFEGTSGDIPDGDPGVLTVYATRGDFDMAFDPATQSCEDFTDTNIETSGILGFDGPISSATDTAVIPLGSIVEGLIINNALAVGNPGLVSVASSAGFGNPGPVVAANFFVDNTDYFFAGGTNAVAMDAFSLLGSSTAVVTFFDEGGAVLGSIAGAAPPTGSFVGVSSPVPIARANVNDTGGGAEGGTDICFAVGEPPELARFQVTKNFDDDNEASVEVTLSCNTGLPLEQTTTIEEGDGVNFVIGDFEQGTLNCTVTETAVDGYTTSYNDGSVSADNCSWEELTGGQYICSITNSLQQSEVAVTKEWIDENPSFNPISVADANWSCSNVATDGFGGTSGNLEFFGNPDTSFFYVYPDWEFGTTCSITEVNLPDGGVEVDDSDCQGILLFPGDDASCTIVNTRLYEGIPTLSQYGLAVLALLMLGMGFVGFRRFV